MNNATVSKDKENFDNDVKNYDVIEQGELDVVEQAKMDFMNLEMDINVRDKIYSEIASKKNELDNAANRLKDKKTEIRIKQNKLLKKLEDVRVKLKENNKANFQDSKFVGIAYSESSRNLLYKLEEISKKITEKGKGKISKMYEGTKDEVDKCLKLFKKCREERKMAEEFYEENGDQITLERLLMIDNDISSREMQNLDFVAEQEMIYEILDKIDQEFKNKMEDLEYFELINKKKNSNQEYIDIFENELRSIERKLKINSNQLLVLSSDVNSYREKIKMINNDLNIFLDNYFENFGRNLVDLQDYLKEVKLKNSSKESSEEFEETVLEFCNCLKTISLSSFSDIETERLNMEILNLTKEIIEFCYLFINQLTEKNHGMNHNMNPFESNAKMNLQNMIDNLSDIYLTSNPEKDCNFKYKLRNLVQYCNEIQDTWSELFEFFRKSQKVTIFNEYLNSYINNQEKMYGIYFSHLLSKKQNIVEYHNSLGKINHLEKNKLKYNGERNQVTLKLRVKRKQEKEIKIQMSDFLMKQKNHLMPPQIVSDSGYMVDLRASKLIESISTFKDFSEFPSDFDDEINREELEMDRDMKLNELNFNLEQLKEKVKKNNCIIEGLLLDKEDISRDKEKRLQTRLKIVDELIRFLFTERNILVRVSENLDYISKPELSRDIGVNQMDQIFTNLVGLTQMVGGEISKLKRFKEDLYKRKKGKILQFFQSNSMNKVITDIKETLRQLNIQQIPQLKEIENKVTEAENALEILQDDAEKICDEITLNKKMAIGKVKEIENKFHGAVDLTCLFDNVEDISKFEKEKILAEVFEYEEDTKTEKGKNEEIERHLELGSDGPCNEFQLDCLETRRGSKALNQSRTSVKKITLDLGRSTKKYDRSRRESQTFEVEKLHTEYHEDEDSHIQNDELKIEDIELNSEIKKNFPKLLFSKILMKYEEEFQIYRSNCISKLLDGILINKKSRISRGIKTDDKQFDPIKFYENISRRKKRQGGKLKYYGFYQRMMRLDLDNFQMLFLLDKNHKRRSRSLISPKVSEFQNLIKKKATGRKNSQIEKSLPSWEIESKISLSKLKDIILPVQTKQMIKSRLPEFYNPHQFYVYNQKDLKAFQNSPYFLFKLEIKKIGRIECVADSFPIFLDIYAGINYLKLIS